MNNMVRLSELLMNEEVVAALLKAETPEDLLESRNNIWIDLREGIRGDLWKFCLRSGHILQQISCSSRHL